MPRSLWFKVLVVVVALWAPLSQADTGWQPIQETIRKSEKIPVTIRLFACKTAWSCCWYPIRRR